MTQFKKYKSIPKTYETRTTDYYKLMGYANQDVEWCVSEKIHGANFSFIAHPDDSPVLHAERENILENYMGGSDTKNFFNHIGIPATTHFDQQVKAMSLHLGKPIQVYTEFYGSGITKSPHIPYTLIPANTTDKGMYRDYIVLDVRIIGESIPTENVDEIASDVYLPLDELITLCDAFGLQMVSVLHRGTMDSCLAFNPEFKSLLAASNGVDTDAEGIVIKPCKPLFDKQNNRIILKHVADKFSDVKLPKEAMAHKQAKTQEANKYNSDAKIIETRANTIRVANRAAGIGITNADKAKFGELMIAAANDIIKEVDSELNIKLDDKQVKNACLPFIKAFFANN